MSGKRFFVAAIALVAAGMRPAAASVASEDDLYYREALYYEAMGQPLDGAAHLLAARRLQRLPVNSEVSDVLLAKMYDQLGMPQLASDAYGRIKGSTFDALRSKAWYQLALYNYHRSEYRDATAALSRTGTGLPYALESRRPFLQSLLLMDLGRNSEAASVINAWQPPLQQDDYTRFNLGVAQLRMGKLLEGAGLLDSVGAQKAENDEPMALRDQANLAMGYGFLRADQGATAKPLFQRVRLDGPSATRALLGAGWAELAPAGNKQLNLNVSAVACMEDPVRVLPSIPILRRPARDACDREKVFRQRAYFEYAPPAKSETERYQRALKPWTVLIERDAADPAVQEALLAVPYVYSRLGQREQAMQNYRRAVESYEKERAQLDVAIQQVRSGPFNRARTRNGAWQERFWKLPRSQDARYLTDLFAGHAMTSMLDDYRSLEALEGELEESGRQLAMLDDRIRRSAGVALPATEEEEAQPASEDSIEPRVKYLSLDDRMLGPIPLSRPARKSAAADARDIGGEHARLRAQLATLRGSIREARGRQEGAIREAAANALVEHRDRLDKYLTQARISLARMLDPALVEQMKP